MLLRPIEKEPPMHNPPLQDHSFSNWSRTVQSTPNACVKPDSETALCRTISQLNGQIRVRGSAHSFTPLCATDATLVSLENIPGALIQHTETDGEQIARLQAGATLSQLSHALHDQGLAFKNLGDIDVQTLAGAAMTATHGTGQSLPCLSGEIRSARLITADGDVIKAEARSDLLNAARVSLGAIGIMTTADVSVRPAFKLRRNVTVHKRVELIEQAADLWDTNRNFEFFVFPFCDHAMSLTHNETSDPNMHHGHSDDEAGLKQLRWLRNATKRLPRLRRAFLNLALGATKPEIQIGTSFELLATVRETRFNEMEYHLPVAHALGALVEIIAIIEKNHPDVFFPIEIRKTAADTGWLSPFEGAPRISIAVHAHQPDSYKWFFTHVEPVFRRFGGRPHWGKLHSLVAKDLHDLYPRFEDFQKLRSQLDPKGQFLNPYLAQLFGVPTP